MELLRPRSSRDGKLGRVVNHQLHRDLHAGGSQASIFPVCIGTVPGVGMKLPGVYKLDHAGFNFGRNSRYANHRVWHIIRDFEGDAVECPSIACACRRRQHWCKESLGVRWDQVRALISAWLRWQRREMVAFVSVPMRQNIEYYFWILAGQILSLWCPWTQAVTEVKVIAHGGGMSSLKGSLLP